ncbi:hypothetical protein [Aurantiacibacter spongiae]|uniref:Uncharacterized protein n=1 Tax=Aurantiacibacter spongiae TaxID=2488860 RepID=A0A3N5CQR8_9SPHN|nr:hypothetical protein [Aurantiacibacter spongiae]RPF71423.1 hypothetical protein EG799_07210 [Aurantiacibacter spongiae]
MRAAPAGCIVLALAGCDGAVCDNRIVDRLPSPDGRFEAVVFERDCGATTAFSTQLSIGSPGMTPRGAGNVFVASRGRPHAEWNGAEATARWLAPDRLEIIVDSEAQIFHEQQYLDGVAMVYRKAG